jgi:hypothetical protein
LESTLRIILIGPLSSWRRVVKRSPTASSTSAQTVWHSFFDRAASIVAGILRSYSTMIRAISRLSALRAGGYVTPINWHLGASVCAQYAGFHPGRVAGFFAIEGIDVPFSVAGKMGAVTAKQRVANAIALAQRQAGQRNQRYATVDDAANRMQAANSFLSPEQTHHLALHGVDRNEDGTFSWKFDDYARWPKFLNTPDAEMKELVSQIECTVLLVRGTESEVPDPAESGLA